jgi:hypothetical protein
MHAADDPLRTVEQELRFIARQAQSIEGGCGADLEAVDEINMSVEAALKALRAYGLTLRPSSGDTASGTERSGNALI